MSLLSMPFINQARHGKPGRCHLAHYIETSGLNQAQTYTASHVACCAQPACTRC